jgi:hypothetical protein
VLIGFLLAGLLGIILVRIREARARIERQNWSLDRFPDSAQPNMTSAGVVHTSQMAMVSVVFWSLLLIIIIGLLAYGAFSIFQ